MNIQKIVPTVIYKKKNDFQIFGIVNDSFGNAFMTLRLMLLKDDNNTIKITRFHTIIIL